MQITIFTIAYNDYGRFIPEWIDNIKAQTMTPSNIIIVLGKDHGADIQAIKKQLKGLEYKIIESSSDIMGVLRNDAIKEVETDWMFYFSADDKLLPNAVEEIYNKSHDNDAVAIKYADKQLSGRIVHRVSAIINMQNMATWRSDNNIPGYIAVKKQYNGRVLYYEPIEIPNYPYLFLLAVLELKISKTDKECAVYQRRSTGHGAISKQTNRWRLFSAKLDEKVKYYQDHAEELRSQSSAPKLVYVHRVLSPEELDELKMSIVISLRRFNEIIADITNKTSNENILKKIKNMLEITEEELLMTKVRIVKKFKDSERYNRIYPLGTEYDVTDERADVLVEKGYCVRVVSIDDAMASVGNTLEEQAEASAPTIETGTMDKPSAPEKETATLVRKQSRATTKSGNKSRSKGK